MNTSNLCSNPSHNSLTTEVWDLPQGYKVYGKVTAAFILMYIVIGMPWNILVVITVLWKKLYHQPTILLLLSLVLNDILMLAIPMPLIPVTGLFGDFHMGFTDAARCHICKAGFISIVLMMNSLFTVALLSIDRFIYIYKPLKYDAKANKRSTLGILSAVIIAIFIICLFLGLLSLVPPGEMYFQPMLLSCTITFQNEWYEIVLVSVASVGLIVIVVFNALVVQIVTRNIKMVYASNLSLDMNYEADINNDFKRKRMKKQLHLFRIFGGLITANLIAWIPLIILILVSFSIDMMDIHPAVVTVTHILFLSQIVVHPILETTLISDVKKPLRRILTCGLLKKKKGHSFTKNKTGTKTCCFIFRVIEYSLVLQDRSSQTMNPSNSDYPQI